MVFICLCSGSGLGLRALGGARERSIAIHSWQEGAWNSKLGTWIARSSQSWAINSVHSHQHEMLVHLKNPLIQSRAQLSLARTAQPWSPISSSFNPGLTPCIRHPCNPDIHDCRDTPDTMTLKKLEVEQSWVSSAKKLSSAAIAELLSLYAEPAEWFAELQLSNSSASASNISALSFFKIRSWAEVQQLSTFLRRTPLKNSAVAEVCNKCWIYWNFI